MGILVTGSVAFVALLAMVAMAMVGGGLIVMFVECILNNLRTRRIPISREEQSDLASKEVTRGDLISEFVFLSHNILLLPMIS